MWIHHLLLLTGALALPVVNGITWIKTPSNQEVFPGQSVILTCEVEGEFTSLQWLGKTRDLETDLLFLENKGQDAQSFNPRFKIVNVFDLKIEVRF